MIYRIRISLKNITQKQTIAHGHFTVYVVIASLYIKNQWLLCGWKPLNFVQAYYIVILL